MCIQWKGNNTEAQELTSPVSEMSQAINSYFTRTAKPFANTASLSEKSVFQDFISTIYGERK